MIERPTARTRTRFIRYTSFEGPRSLHRSAPLGPPSTNEKSPNLHASSKVRALSHTMGGVAPIPHKVSNRPCCCQDAHLTASVGTGGRVTA